MIVTLPKEYYKIRINKSEQAFRILLETLKTQDEIDQDKEHFIVIGLKRNNCIRFVDIVSVGILTGTIVHPREVFRRSILHACNSIVVAHNHPSGNLQPSTADDAITRNIKEAGKIIDIQLTDHIIFSNEGHYSYADEGKLF
ncbi:MAG TPA: JAB domain-containing protein [Bacteroidia bacterium]|nr:JAB domain-containing protein [Bacteroidia bacterium]